VIGRIEAAWDSGVAWARRHSRVFDHFWSARERYHEVLGARLAAAIAYYGFFAALALSLLAYSILGYLLAGDTRLLHAVNGYLHDNLPFLNTDDIQNSRQAVAVVSIIGFVFTGVGWIDGMRSSQRAIWRVEQQPGNVFVRRAIDLAMLVALGLLLGLSLWVTTGVESIVRRLLDTAAPGQLGSATDSAIRTTLSVTGQVLSFLLNIVVASSLLTAVPRLRVSARRMLPSILLVALGLSLLSTVGRVLIRHTQDNPAYQLAGWAVGLLIFINLFSQLLLFGAALAATRVRGRAVDLATGVRPDELAAPEPPAVIARPAPDQPGG
jgi:membrane protein